MTRIGNAAMAAATAISAAIAAPAFAGTQFLAYQGPNAVRQGQGGDMKTVDGVEFWLDGSPPHRFQVLGAVEDERLKTGIIGMIRMSSLEHDMARLARGAGGDAVILTDAHDDLKGVVGSSFGSAYGTGYSSGGFASFNAWGSSTSYTHPVESRASRYVVVKYLPDDPAGAPAAPPAWSAPQASAPDDGPPAVATTRF